MQKKTAIILITILCFAVSALTALSGWLYAAYESPEEIAAKAQVLALSADLVQADNEITELQAQLLALNGQFSEKLLAIEKLETDIETLITDGIESDAYQNILLDRLEEMKADLNETRAEMARLYVLIENYENITTLNFGYQAKKISDLLLYLAEDNRPLHINRTEIKDAETGEIIETIEEEVPSNISFYYRDIATGYTLSYNAEEVMYSASLVKVPYIYILLKSVADFEEQKLNFDRDGNPLYGEDGEPLFDGDHPNLDEDGRILYGEGEEKYDLTRIWTFDKETMMQDGTGIIREMEDGIQLTYLELIEYTLLYSDNIAFYELCQTFGYMDYYLAARELGVNAISNGFMKMSVAECGIFLEKVYTFIEENEKYGSFVKEAMIHSNYPVLIPYCVRPTVAAHKYGWDLDAYNDMAIVYDEHPYLLVVMTDLDTGGVTVNKYVQDVVRMIHSIHETFYEGVGTLLSEVENEESAK